MKKEWSKTTVEIEIGYGVKNLERQSAARTSSSIRERAIEMQMPPSATHIC